MVSTVKERLTGALILIVALVIIVPELFSDRPKQHPPSVAPAQSADAGPPLRSYTMDLGAGQAAPAKVPEPVAPAAPAPVAEASPAAASPAAAPTKPAATPEASKPGAAATSKAAAHPPAPAHGWWVQLGSFSARANADRLAGTLGSAGYSIRVSPSTKNGKELFRVLAGPAADRAAAVELQARLSAAGHKGTLVAP